MAIIAAILGVALGDVARWEERIDKLEARVELLQNLNELATKLAEATRKSAKNDAEIHNGEMKLLQKKLDEALVDNKRLTDELRKKAVIDSKK